MEKKFKYCQIDYPCYPSEGDLNKLGEIGWELVCVEGVEYKYFNCELENTYIRKIYKATFKREIVI